MQAPDSEEGVRFREADYLEADGTGRQAMDSRLAYHSPSSFHQPKPTMLQTARWQSEMMKPIRHQSFMEAYPWAKNMGEGVVP